MKNNQKKISDNDLVVITGGSCNACVCSNNKNNAIKPVIIGLRSHYQECKADCLESGAGFNDFMCIKLVNLAKVLGNIRPINLIKK